MNAIQKPRYTFRPGALDAIMRSRNLTSDTQLAAVLGVRLEDVPKLRAGAAHPDAPRPGGPAAPSPHPYGPLS